MVSYEEALVTIISRVTPAGWERVPILEALGRVVSEPQISGNNIPSFDNSAMDGYAVSTSDCIPGGILPVCGAIMAGDTAKDPLPPHTAVKIMTGAPIPCGANAVIPFEEVVADGSQITLPKLVIEHQHIRFCGEDVSQGAVIIEEGTVIRPAEISLLVSAGKTILPVYRRVRVAILSTGDELVEPGEVLCSGGVINSNSYALASAVAECGAEPVMLGIARDNRESLKTKLVEGLKSDVLITSAGVSAGERDLVREVLEELQVNPVFWKIAIKPGGPTAFGMSKNKPVFALPGNPVSSLLTFEEFVRPALLKMMGHKKYFKASLKAVLQEEMRKKGGKTSLIRVKVVNEGGHLQIVSAGNQQTSIVKTLLQADAIAILPAERDFFAAGEFVTIHLISGQVMMTG